ncbi:MAG: EAL domain-containing protein [Propionivibrio sp.]
MSETENPADKPAVSLRRSLRNRVGLLVSGAVLAVSAGFFLFGVKPIVDRVAENQFTRAAAQLEASLDMVFAPAEQILRMSRGWIGAQPPALDDPAELNRLFLPVLETLPQASSVVAGTSSGAGWMLLRNADGGTISRMTDLPRWGNEHRFFERDASGAERSYRQTFEYDPRSRAWYTAAVATRNGVQWTEPYAFFTTGDPGITASTHLTLGDGRDMVVGIDLKLRDLSATTMSAGVSAHGMALVLTQDRRVLALPAPPAGVDPDGWPGKVLKQSSELGITALNDALADWRPGDGNGVRGFRSQGAAWLTRIQPYQLGNTPFWVVTLAPEADFAPSWLAMLGVLACGLAVTLLLVALFAQQQARRIARPLEALAEASERIGSLDFAAEAPKAAGITDFAEIRKLAASHEKMRGLLLDNRRALATQEDELRRQIAALSAAEEKIRESEAHFRMLSENVSDVVWQMDGDNRITYISPADERMRGFLADEVIGHHILETLTEESAAEVKKRMAQRMADEQKGIRTGTMSVVAQQHCKDGHLIWTETLSTPERDEHGKICGFHGMTRDITERRLAEEALSASEARLFTILENVDACIYLKDPDGRYLFANRAVRDLWQVANMADIVGFGDERFFDAETTQYIRNNDRQVLEYGDTIRREETNTVSATGKTAIYQSTKLPLWREDGTIYALCGISTDITALKAHEEQLKHIAHYDALTTLPNRVLLADRLQQAMTQTIRRGQLLAVAYLDLDGFKTINDRHGHKMGDQLLIALANSMKDRLREGDTLARLGGDEFIAVLIDLDGIAGSLPMLTRMLAAAAQPVSIGDSVLQVSASLGVTFYPQAEDVDADQLLRQADQAMYQAKLAGKNRYHVFDADQDRSVRGYHESLEHIRRALNEHEFVLHYQPKVNMRTGQVIGVEALIRWQHPERGLLAPSVFLPVIEEHALAVNIGDWVIDSALTQAERWQAAGLDIPVSVNIGARQLQQDDFVDRLRARLAAHPTIRPSALVMEVLETSALEDLARVSAVIESCRQFGVLFSLDDFGTGYSSLTYLKRLAVDQLKIDQSFVRDMLDDPDDLAILGGVLSLATAFRREVIAEGVETVEHGTMLLQLGCELAQGYGIARPMPAADFPGWFATWQPDPAWTNLPPLNREDLPLLFACVEHRAWLASVEAFLRGERDMLPLIHHQCRFNTWLETEGRTRHEGRHAMQAIKDLHRDVHALADELCELRSRGNATLAMQRTGELHALKDELLERLTGLLGNGNA